MTRDFFKKRFEEAINLTFKKARESLIEDIPGEYMILLEFSDRKKSDFVSLEEAIDLIMKDESVPEWINIYFSKVSDDKSIIGCELGSRYFQNEEELMYQDEGVSPFRVGYPNLPEFFKGKKYSIKDLKRE